ncbi:MAG: LON peptidase substrate-binding domain-containing protein [Cohaesibacter sp.]|nr:LON peptidase substrate-binding domain-containing protein [Cohaesibacter sp.]MCV6576815.1 LON peptidase substrate-binding domain-containing protein [Cohaesibacter sp.]MCV6601575.1 LON peptidase substrate-binding domain-containing protein [Cohaesibacter sp.]
MAQAGNVFYDSPRDIPAVIPLFPLEEALLLPRTQMPLNIFEERYIAMIDHAIRNDRIIGIIQPHSEQEQSKEENKPSNLYPIGCLGRISAYGETGDGRVLITLTGISRFRVTKELETDTPYRLAEIDCEDFTEDLIEGFGEDAVERKQLLDVFRSFLEANNMEADWDSVDKSSNEILVNSLSMMSPYGIAEKQALLEAESLALRAQTLIAITEMHLATESDAPSTILQ